MDSKVIAFLLWLASFPALGVVASYALQGLKALFPRIKDKAAVIASVLLTAVAAIAANLLLARGIVIPAWLEQLWPTLTWLISQIWFAFVLKKPTPVPMPAAVTPPGWEGDPRE